MRNEYLAAENRILRVKIKGRLQLLDGEERALAEIAHRLGRKALAEVAVVPSRIRFWAGFANWWRASLTARNFANRSAAARRENHRGSDCAHGTRVLAGCLREKQKFVSLLVSAPRHPDSAQRWTTFLPNHCEAIACLGALFSAKSSTSRPDWARTRFENRRAHPVSSNSLRIASNSLSVGGKPSTNTLRCPRIVRKCP